MAPSSTSTMTISNNNKLPLRHKIGATVTPGDRLGLASRGKTTFISGKGTYIRQGHLYSSLLGTLCATTAHHHDKDNDNDDNASSDNNNEEGESYIISINSERTSSDAARLSYAKNATANCPQVGMLVLGRITRVVRPSHAMVDIVAIVPDDAKQQQQQTQQQQKQQQKQPFIIPLHEPFSGTLRQNEIRPNSSLEVHIEECLRPGDVVLAKIHANGERDFILTTAEAELGVIQAVCESSGVEMRAVSWKEMQCPVSGVKEGRKVAKPRQR